MLVDKMIIFTKPYLVNVLILNLLETLENLAFFTAFRGYEMKILAINELITKGQYTLWKLSVFRIFSHIQTEYGEILGISLYSTRMRENMDQKNSEYRQFSRSDRLKVSLAFGSLSSISLLLLTLISFSFQ